MTKYRGICIESADKSRNMKFVVVNTVEFMHSLNILLTMWDIMCIIFPSHY